MIYGGFLILNTFIFYSYLVFLHKEGRIIDIYTRVTAESKHFFVPIDNEVSERYLRWVITKIQLGNKAAHSINDSTKHASITYHTVVDPDLDYHKSIIHMKIYRKSIALSIIIHLGDGKLALYRHFVKTSDGAICELEEGVPFTVDNYPMLETWPKKERKDMASEDSKMIEEVKEKPQDFLLQSIKESNLLEELASPIVKKDDGNISFEPQVKLVKNE